MTVEQLAKIDSREVYGDDSIRIDCDCNADKACNECIDGGLYDGPMTDDGQLPAPPPFIVVDDTWNEEDERAMHTLTHCENEQDCRTCNPAVKPSDLQVDGPKSCDKYYNDCQCRSCAQRDVWYSLEST